MEQTININGVDIFVKDVGQGVPLLMLHGSPDTAEMWAPLMARLKENLFDCGSADSYNVCEWASIDRLERGKRGGNIAALRATSGATGAAPTASRAHRQAAR